MFKKPVGLGVTLILLATFLSPPAQAQYRAEDIFVPPGYKVIKVAESNKIVEPYRLTFDSAGNLIAGGYGFVFFKVDPNGDINLLGKTRKFNIDPVEVEPAPDGSYLIRSFTLTALNQVYRSTAPDSYVKVIEENYISAIGYDRRGNFYAAFWDPSVPSVVIVRYDGNYAPTERIYLSQGVIDFVFDTQNNLFVLQPRAAGFPGYVILKIPAGENGIPDATDPQGVFASGLTDANNMAIDDQGNIYTDAYVRRETDGFSVSHVFRLEKTHADGSVEREFGPELPQPGGLACEDGFIYISEWFRGVITRMDLATLEKSDFTEDFGLDAAGPIAFDVNDDLYTHSFRPMKLFRMNEDRSFSQVGAGTGYAQSIACDGVYFYLASADGVGSNGNQILRIDPVSGATDVMATRLGGWRTVTFDAYGRLILCSIVNSSASLYRADIIDLASGVATPYVTGLQREKGMVFDSRQNIYISTTRGDGIKKVALDENYDPPRDLSGEPVFYDLTLGDPIPPMISFFTVNAQEEVFIPRYDAGDVLVGDKGGNVQALAQGFITPGSVTIDRYGALYISDTGNGIFKIVHERWTVPAVIKLKEALIEEIRASGVPQGNKTSLIKILFSVDESLLKNNRKAAIGTLAAFRSAVLALAGKKIPLELATDWMNRAAALIKALSELD